MFGVWVLLLVVVGINHHHFYVLLAPPICFTLYPQEVTRSVMNLCIFIQTQNIMYPHIRWLCTAQHLQDKAGDKPWGGLAFSQVITIYKDTTMSTTCLTPECHSFLLHFCDTGFFLGYKLSAFFRNFSLQTTSSFYPSEQVFILTMTNLNKKYLQRNH